MTRIIKLEMKGFKSFARQTDILFNNDFNVVLGPNGSGKSNVIDALTFVLGKSSAKSLRAEKSANLIYNGGKSKQGAKEGEVSIFFTNDEKEFPLDAKEVKVTRIIRDNGQSIYKINGKKHTRNEVLDLLTFAKIDPDGYNIILQGDIVQLVEMSGEERRKVIEQISDISIYEDKKLKALSELEKVEGSFKEAQIILNERKSYLSDLSKEREQAMEFKDLERDMKSGRATLLDKTIQEKRSGIEKITNSNSAMVEKQKKLQEEITTLRKEIATKKTDIVAINRDIEARGDAEQVALHKKIEQLKVDVGTSKNKIQSIEDEINKIKERKSQLKETKVELTTKIDSLILQQKELATKKQSTTKLQGEIKQKIEDFRKKHNLEGANELETKIEALDKQIDEKQKEVDTLREQHQELLRSKDRLELQIKNADEKINKVLEVSKLNKAEIEQLKQRKIEFKKITVELSQKLNQDAALASQLGSARAKVNFLNEELAKLNARKASIQETLGGSMAISKLIENKNKIGGVFGTISSLGTVDAKYAKALEVAAGNKIKAIVVEDDGVAEKCIKYLKENQLGVATFLPLNKIRGHAVSEQDEATAKKTHGLAIDLVKFDKKFKNIFSHVFTNTAIVDDIAQSRKIGIGAIRMVTLDGDLAEQSGVMQGGFRKGTTTGLGFTHKEVADKTEQYERELVDAQSICSTFDSQKLNGEEQIQKLRELKANLEGDIIKQEKSLHLDDDDLDMSKKLKAEFEKELTTVSDDYFKATTAISTINRTLAQFKIDRQALRNQITDLRNPIKLAELTTFEEKLRQLQEESINVDGELKHIESQIVNILNPEQENVLKVIKQQEKEEQTFLHDKNLLSESISHLGKQLAELEEKEKGFYKQFKDAFTKRQKLTDEIDALEEKTIKKEEDIRDAERRNTVVSIEVAKLQAELQVLAEEFKDFGDVQLMTEKSAEEIKSIVTKADNRLRSIGSVNMKAIDMYDRVDAEYKKLVEKRQLLTDEKEQVLLMINEIELRKKDLFLSVFNRLNENFQKIFTSLSTKGEAYLELENPEEPFSGGVTIKVKLAGKKFMDIRSLSGGEKTMTALAFIFAIQENEPASFYIMDEVDAALDKRNAEKLAELIKQYSQRAQYIVISHNDGVISAANTLYGVSMDTDGVSKVVSLKL